MRTKSGRPVIPEYMNGANSHSEEMMSLVSGFSTDRAKRSKGRYASKPFLTFVDRRMKPNNGRYSARLLMAAAHAAVVVLVSLAGETRDRLAVRRGTRGKRDAEFPHPCQQYLAGACLNVLQIPSNLPSLFN